MFASGAAEISRNSGAKVLSVGLGAGYLNSFLYYHFPKMDITIVELDPMILRIARKWYDLNEDYRQRVIIDDGLNYIRMAVENGIQYDAVHLDACTTDHSAKAFCPLNAFFTEEIASVLSKLITKQGVVTMNVVSSTDFGSDVIANELKSHYEKFFHQCAVRNEENLYDNRVLSCTHTTRPEGLSIVYKEFIKANG